MKKTLFFIFFVISLNSMAIYHMRNWTLPPNKVTMTYGNTPVVSALPGSPTGTYAAANGAYDENNNLLFYVIDGTIYSATGSSLTTAPLSTPYYYAKEIVILPVPGQCKKYYVVCSRATALTAIELYRTTVDCSSGTASVPASPGTWTTITSTLSGNFCGMAASKVISGSGSTALRYLYVLTRGSGAVITRYTVSSSGIASPTTINTAAMQLLPTNGMISELELNQDGSKLAWGYGNTANGKVYELATASPNTLITYTLTNPDQNIMGIEYDGSNNLWISAQSVTTLNNGIYKITTTATPSYLKISGTSAYNNTQLEKSNNSYIYAVNNSGTMAYIDETSNSFTTSSSYIPAVTLVSNGSGLAVYSLPDQVDFEDYSYFNGIPLAKAAFSINGTASTNSSCGALQNVYNCVPIVFSNQTTGSPISYTLTVNSIDINCNTISGAGYLNYNSGTITTLPTDLRAMPGTNGNWLDGHTGKFKVQLTATNGCTITTATAYLQVNGAPSAAVANFQINNPVSGTPCFSSNAGSPCTLCTGSPTMNISSSTGTITYYKKTTEQLISGTWTIVNGPTTVAGGVVGLTGVYVTQSGFSYMLGVPYRVTVEVGNDCGSNAKTCYFTAVACKTDGEETEATTSAIDNISGATFSDAVALYPNPTQGNATLQFTNEKAAMVSAFITDLQGRKVLTIAQDKSFGKGEHNLDIASATLANGVYIYHITINNKTTSGKFVKTN